MQKKLIIVCLINFLIAALMGLALRYTYVGDINFDYRYLTHAHSHVAMLGWVYLMLYTLIVYYFIEDNKPIFKRLFWVTQLAVVGMMISFPFQGYAAISITFSTLHIFCSYYFVYLIWKHQKVSNPVSRLLLKTALVFMVTSTFGVWCLGPAVATLGSASAFYQIAIQFFLHFQFNGWFLIAVLALFFHVFKVEDSKLFRQFYKVLILSTLLTFALPIHWFLPHNGLLVVNAIGIVSQLIMLYYLVKLLRPTFNKTLIKQQSLIKSLYVFTALCFILKIGLQALGLLPEFSQIVYTQRNLIIGFIHLLMLGVITGFLFSLIFKKPIVSFSKSLYVGVYTFVIGFVFTELLLAIQGFNFYLGLGLFPNYYLLLFLFSILLPLGIMFILYNIFKTKQHEN